MSLLQYMDADASFDEARYVLFGCPYDGTVSYRPGARFGPQALREASWGTESYSPYLNKSITDLAIHDAGDVALPFGNTRRALDCIGAEADRIVSAGKIPVAFGGEHLISLPVIQRVFQAHPDLAVLHFDAHTDLREDYEGEPLSHATVIRRVLDFLPVDRLYQFGIRSGTKVEFDFAREKGLLNKTTPDAARAVLEKVKDRPVYITVDLDVFDPAFFPGTGTPEPGGIDFNAFSDMLKVWSGKLNIVGLDAVELAPMLDSSGISNSLAAKVTRELLLLA